MTQHTARLGDIVASNAQTGHVVHVYTDDAGERMAYVRFTDGHKGRRRVADLHVLAQYVAPDAESAGEPQIETVGAGSAYNDRCADCANPATGDCALHTPGFRG